MFPNCSVCYYILVNKHVQLRSWVSLDDGPSLLVTLIPIGPQVKGEESQTAEVVNVEALLPQDRDYLTYQVDIFTWI